MTEEAAIEPTPIGECVECGDPIFEAEARIEDGDGQLHHVEHYPEPEPEA